LGFSLNARPVEKQPLRAGKTMKSVEFSSLGEIDERELPSCNCYR
jgi:hypothetical protein